MNAPAPTLVHDARQDARPRILISLGAGWPGHEASGPVISINALCATLDKEFHFLTISPDRASPKRVREVAPSHLAMPHPGEITHLAPGLVGPRGMIRILRKGWNLVYLNSFFDRSFTLLPLLMMRSKLATAPKILIAPRGELSPGAMAFKRQRKSAYIAMLRQSHLLDGVWMHATSELEQQEIATVLPEVASRILVAPNLRKLNAQPAAKPRTPNPLKVVFLSRIDRKKNLDFALRALAEVQTPADFAVYGPVSDQDFWNECQPLIAQMPPHIRVGYNGLISNAAVQSALVEHDVFFLPTLGENFGHSIFDALSAGLPVLISDQTPWRDLKNAHAGWDISLDAGVGAFASVLDGYAKLSLPERDVWRAGARMAAESHIQKANAAEVTASMFRRVIAA